MGAEEEEEEEQGEETLALELGCIMVEWVLEWEELGEDMVMTPVEAGDDDMRGLAAPPKAATAGEGMPRVGQ